MTNDTRNLIHHNIIYYNISGMEKECFGGTLDRYFIIVIFTLKPIRHGATYIFIIRIFGHTLLPFHSFKMSLNDSHLCTLRNTPAICDINHIFFNCPVLSVECSSFLFITKFPRNPI